MSSNGNPSLSRQKSMTSRIKQPDIHLSSRQSLESSKPSKPLQKSPQVTMLRKVTIAVLKAENPQMAHLFGSNYGPSDSELEIIHQYLKAAKAEQLKYRHMELELPGPHSDGQQSRILAHNIQQINKAIEYWKSLLAPIRRIPPEILCHIFSSLVPLEVHPPHWHRRMRLRVDAPFVLLHICRYWRDLASSTSSLWRRLPDISLREVKPDRLEGRLALLLKSVDLAKQDFAVYIRGPDWERDPLALIWDPDWVPVPQLFVDFLCRTSYFWAECTVSAPHASLECLEGIKGNTPNLRKLTLFFGNRRNQPGPARDYTMNLFEHAPLLRSLHIAGPHDGYIAIPMHQLSHLKDHSLGERASSRLLRFPVYPDLVYLELTDRHMEPSSTLKFPRLQHFQINSQIKMETGCLPRAIFPSLLKLMVLAKGSTGDTLGVIERAIRRSDCTNVESLSVYYTHDRAENYQRTRLSSLLAATPHLAQLDLIADPTDIQDLANFYNQDREAAPTCKIYVASPVRDEMTAALRQLGVSWRGSERDEAASPGSESNKATLKICPYESASLCDPPQRPLVTPAMLERWFSDPRRTILHSLSIKLRTTHLGERVCADSLVRWIYFHTIQEREELSNLLSKVESYTPKTANEILLSNIHFVMARLAALFYDYYQPCGPSWNRSAYFKNPLHEIREQFLRIMKKWHEILMKESLDDIHWIWSTSNKLLFVPDNASVRKDKKRWASTILGMPKLHTEA